MKPVRFADGFNVVYGDIEKKTSQSKKNEHNLGKTSLVNLIDFLLLKGITKKHFLSKYKSNFEGWVFYIEIKLDEDRFLTVKRCVDVPTRISFKEHSESNQDFSASDNWDKKDVRMNSRKELDAVTILEQYLDFNVAENYPYRHFLTYLLRTQVDYESVFKMKQFQGPDASWKPQLFDLLGFSDEVLKKKYRTDYDIATYRRLLKTIEESDTTDSYTLKAAIAEKESEKSRVVDQISKFDFYLQEKKLSKELVYETETKISQLNNDRYRLENEINRIRESLENNIAFDFDEVKEVFSQVEIFFPEDIEKSYQDLIKFNQSISKERSKYLKEDLKSNLDTVKEISNELKRLNKEKEDMLAFLRDTDTFSKYRALQMKISELEEQIHTYKIKIETLGTAENYEKEVDDLKTDSKRLAKKVKEVIDEGNDTFNEIKEFFKELYEKIMGHTTLLIVKPNKEGNPVFEPVTIDRREADKLTGQSDGHTATKMQCSIFVLAFLMTYSNKNFFKFAYHDGLIESWNDGLKIKFFAEIREVCKQYGIQYIISVIKSDVPGSFEFKDEEKVVSLSKEKTLFGMKF